MGTLETPQDRHGYIHRTGPPEWNKQTEAKVEQGAQEAKAGGPWWPWPRPSARPQQPGPLYPPQKITMGQLRGTRSPPGRTYKNSKKTVVTVWSNTATAGWLVNTAAAVWGYHNRLA